MVVFSLLLQIGFVIVGGQAGRLLDVRQIKRHFPRVVAGFVVGFTVAGALAGPLQQLLGATVHLLLAAAGAATAMLVMLVATNVRYRGILAQADQSAPRSRPQRPAPPLRKVLTKRFVLLIFAYQMLSAMATQLIEYMVMAAAGARFSGSDALARFYGNFTFALNLTDLLFLALVAGLLLSRFGLKFGLTFNPGAVVLLLAAIVISAATTGVMSPLFFGLVLLTRIADLTFTDATTRTSINAAYQALPAHERVTVQAGVEGIGVPVALGLTGVSLLVFNAFAQVTLLHVAVYALIISVIWTLAALWVFRDYGANLLHTMHRRTLGAAGLALDDATLPVVRRLLDGTSTSDVRLALDMLQQADHPALAEELPRLAQSATADIQVEALTRIEQLRLQAALPVVRRLSTDAGTPRVQGAALRARCALEEADAVEAVLPALEEVTSAASGAATDDVRVGAAVGLLRYGSTPGILAVGARLSQWAQAEDTATRAFLARVIGATADPHFYQPLVPLLADADVEVRRAALHAAGRVRHARLLPQVLENLATPATRAAASDALVAYGDLMLPWVEQHLTQEQASPEETVRLVRACLPVQSDAVIELLSRHVDHPVRAVRDQVLAVLSGCGYRAGAQNIPALDAALEREVGQAYALLQAQAELGEDARFSLLQRALHDEAAQVRRRILWLLSFIYEAGPVLRAGTQLVQGTSGEQALAFEMFDVTLSPAHKSLILPLLDPKMEPTQRLRLLGRHVDSPTMSRAARLRDLTGPGQRGWVRTCALHSIARSEEAALLPTVEELIADPDPLVRETSAWCLHTLAPARFAHHATALAADPDAQVARVAIALADATGGG